MRFCGDLCNGTKHLFVKYPKLDARFSVCREYVPANTLGKRPNPTETWIVLADGKKYDVFELADRCMSLWEIFLNETVQEDYEQNVKQSET